MKVIINKLGPVMNRNVQNNAKVDCFYPRFFMLFLNDKMSQEDKIFYMNSPVAPTSKSCTKLMTRLTAAKKHNRVPLTVTPFMLEQFNAQLQPYQLQVAPPPQPLQQLQPGEPLPPFQPQQEQPQQQPEPQEMQQQHHIPPLLLIQDYQSSSQSSHYSPYQSPHQSPLHHPSPPPETEPPQHNFFPVQQSSILPSQSEPTPSNVQTQYFPQTQSTSQPLPADSDIDIELQNFRDDLQVAEVLSNLSSNFTVDVSDYDCDIDLVCQTASIEPENTQVHNQADEFVSTTDSSSNTSTNTTTPGVKKVARKRSGSAMIRQPAALSHKKLRAVSYTHLTLPTIYSV